MLDPLVVADLRELQREHGVEAVAKVVSSFLDSAGQRLAYLRSAAAGADACRISSLAHSLGGSSGLFGAQRMAALCQQVEALAASAASGEGMAALLDRLASAYAQVRRELERVA